MTIYIMESEDDYTFQLRREHRTMRIEKPYSLEDAKREIKKAWNLVGERVTWEKH